MASPKTITLRILCILTSVVLVALLAIVCTAVSPIYDFSSPRPFSGKEIFNPYAALDSLRESRDGDFSSDWLRANFHTHTKVEGPFNECDHTPQETYDSLVSLGYDVVTFSNHNSLTQHPFDPSLQVNVYEHGYNLFKYHKLVFGSSKVNRFDALLPLLTSQKQFQLDILGRDCDFIQLNHPLRTVGTSKKQLECLSGYSIIELDSGMTTENEYWDWALSAGNYSFGLANDDLHYPDRSWCIATRCNFLMTPSASYEDLKRCLMTGCYYSMRVPDFGNGDWTVKREGNRNLPKIKDIGLVQGDSIFVNLSRPASSIVFSGQNHNILYHTDSVSSAGYRMCSSDSYVRITAVFGDGCVIYSNPFARFDPSSGSVFAPAVTHKVNVPLTILYNLGLLVAAYATVALIVRMWRSPRKKKKRKKYR